MSVGSHKSKLPHTQKNNNKSEWLCVFKCQTRQTDVRNMVCFLLYLPVEYRSCAGIIHNVGGDSLGLMRSLRGDHSHLTNTIGMEKDWVKRGEPRNG